MSDARATRYSIQRSDRAFLIRSLLFVVAMALLATWSAWPIYGVPYLLVTAVLAIISGTGVAWFGLRNSWTTARLSVSATIVYAIVIIPAAMPSAFTSFSSFLSSMLSILTGPFLGWKKLLTIELPVGTFEDLLVPFFLVVFVGVLSSLTVMWRTQKRHFLPVLILLGMQLFGPLFGYSVSSSQIQLGSLVIPVSREVVTGLLAFFFALGFLSWRLRYARGQALSQGIQRQQVSPVPLSARVRRNFSALAVLAVAVPLAILWNGTLTGSTERKVLRNSVDPAVEIAAQSNPLADYRSFFTPENLNTELFVLDASAALPERIRLAVLDAYDGEFYRVVSTKEADSASGGFARIPMAIPSQNGAADTARLGVEIVDYNRIWMPTVAELQTVDFRGQGEQRLAEGFYFNLNTRTGVEVPAFSPGDKYTLSYYIGDSEVSIDKLQRTSKPGELLPSDLIPPRLQDWVELQTDVPTNPAGLLTLIERLRNRGFLSHSLLTPVSDDPAALWMSQLPGYPGAQPSLSGHSVSRINELFDQLVEKQKNTSAGAPNEQLIAAVGDDEQFAVAASLLAEYLGYPSRVVLGFRTSVPEGVTAGVPPCLDAVCRGGNLTAWLELRDTTGAWIPVDVTPQFTNSLAPDILDRRDPENPTEVIDENAENLPPSATNPEGESEPQTDEGGGLDLGWLWALLRGLGTFLLILALILSPFALIVGAKLYRLRDRKAQLDPAENIAGGWDEYVDLLVDYGAANPGTKTRHEYAVAQSRPNALALATLADGAVFGFEIPPEASREQAWALVEEERAHIQAELPLWRRYLGWLSLRSFSRYLGVDPFETARKGALSLAKATRRRSMSGFGAFATYVAKQTQKRKSRSDRD